MGCLPVTSKCCFCVPRRPGLLVWAYIKLVLTLAVLAYWVFTTWFFVGETNAPTDVITQLTVVGSLLVVAAVFSVVFVIGLHKKNYKMVYVFYWFSVLELLLTLGWLAWVAIDVIGRPWYRDQYFHSLTAVAQLILTIVFNTLLPIYFIIVIRSELLVIKGGGERPATTADGETRVVLGAPVAKEQARRYHFVYSSPEFEHKVDNTSPLFPVEELRIERLRQQLGQ